MDKIKIIKDIIEYIVIIGAVLLVKFYIVTPIKVNGNSMNPNLYNKDLMFLNEITYRFNDIERFDIVVVDLDFNGKSEKIIKRVIGLPGETVEFKDNKLYINGKYIEENFEHDVTSNFTMEEIGSKIIPDGYYFVAGDNRGDSLDSRIVGLINKKDIMGKASIVFYPFSRIGRVK